MTSSTASQSPAQRLANLPRSERAAWLQTLSKHEQEALLKDWNGFLARPPQRWPAGDWNLWILMGGRGFGKTRAGAEAVREAVRRGYRRIALIGPTTSDVRNTMIEGESGIISTAWSSDYDYGDNLMGIPEYRPALTRLTWANGAQAWTYSAQEPERLRGPQFDFIWHDEMAAWGWSGTAQVNSMKQRDLLKETWDMSQFCLRLGKNPAQVISTTPKVRPLIRQLMKRAQESPKGVITTGTTFDNAANLAPEFTETLQDYYGGTRIGRQELMAEFLEDIVGALWTNEMILLRTEAQLPKMIRKVVAVDPSGAGGQEDAADEIGIVVAGVGEDERFYVLADKTTSGSPETWGMQAVRAYYDHQCDRMIAETNYGGAMVESLIRNLAPNVSYKSVTASRGKVIRAEPIAALYEQHRVFHVGGFEKLEDQMCAMTLSGYQGQGSPDRVDALVWALSELSGRGAVPQIRSL